MKNHEILKTPGEERRETFLESSSHILVKSPKSCGRGTSNSVFSKWPLLVIIFLSHFKLVCVGEPGVCSM